MRSPLAVAASAVLAGSLVLAGCTGTSGSDEPKGSKATSGSTSATGTPSSKGTAAAKDKTLPSTAWRTAESAEVAQGGVLRLAASTLPRNFNPLQSDAADSDAAQILAPTAGSAVRITDDGGWDVDPNYAESVEITDEDPLTVQVKLNPSAVWAGGTAITAQDMVAFWKAQNGSNTDYQVISTDGYDQISAVTPGKDKFSYTVTFKQPTADWPQYVYPRLAANVSSSTKLFNQAFRKRAISSNGPYVVTSIDTDAGVITEKPNPRWWGAKPKLDKITWNIADPTVQAQAYANGELDAVDLQASTYDIAKDTGTIERAAGTGWSQVTLNGGRGPLADVDVRRAVARAINREPIATDTAKALGAPAAPLGSLLLVPGQQGYQDSATSIAYDPAAARKLLAKAGYTEGADKMFAKDGAPLELTLPVPKDTPANKQRADLIVKDLKAVGIAVKLRSVPADTFFDDVVIPLDFDLVTFMRTASPFPIAAAEPFYFPIDSAQNYTGIGPARFGTGFATVLGTLDDELRLKRIAKLDEWLFEDVPVVPLAVTPLVMGVRKTLVNYGAAQFEQPDWTTVGYLTKKKQ